VTNRSESIRDIKEGDIFHAVAPNGASLVCQALIVSDAIIEAQRMFMPGDIYRFDRTTGVDERGGILRKIDSVALLPDDIRDVLLKLDHRIRTSNAPGSAKLSEPEKKALIFIYDHYRNNQI